MANFNKPELTSTYTNFITELKARDNTISSLFSDGTTHTGTYPVRAIRWNATNNYFERRNAANNGFERLEGNSGTHKFVNLETGSITATGATINGNLSSTGQVQAARVNVTGSTKPANGMYLGASNEVRLTTNSADRLTIESNGEVGIGTVDPNQKLEVVGAARIQNGSSAAFLEIGAGGSGNRFAYLDLVGDATHTDFGLRLMRQNQGANAVSELVHKGTGNFILEATDAADLIFKTAGSNRMVIDSGGSVCIGDDLSPDDHLHVRKATNDAVFIRVSNNEGYARFGTDENHMVLDNDVINLRNRAGNTTYLISSSSLFDVKTAAKVNGNLQVTSELTVDNNIKPSSGNADNKGIIFPTNIGGGTGDKAFIRYYVDGSGEDTRLLIGIENDADDDIYLQSSLVHTSGNFSVNGTCTATSFSGNGANITNVAAASVSGINNSSGINITGRKMGLGTTPASTFNTRNAALAMGDNDTGIAQNGGGQLELWANNVEVVNITKDEVTMYKSVIPSGSHNLGSSSNPWSNLYINDLNMSNKGKTNDVDGTWGDYTIQEGHEDLYLLNHRTGKKFKFALIPVAN